MGITLHKNIAIDHIPRTPATPFPFGIEKDLEQSREILLAYGKEYGHPVSYIQEQDGQLIQNIVPVHKTEYQQISTSSKNDLKLHTELAFHPYKPSYIMLLCLRGDPAAATTYAEVHDIVERLSGSTIDTLREPLFITSLDESFRTNGEPDTVILTPILSTTSDGIAMIYDADLMLGTTIEAAFALNFMHKAIVDCTRNIILETGDLLIIDNSKTVHGRKAFQPRYDGTDRWVQRLLIRKDLPPKEHILPSSYSIINTRF